MDKQPDAPEIPSREQIAAVLVELCNDPVWGSHASPEDAALYAAEQIQKLYAAVPAGPAREPTKMDPERMAAAYKQWVSSLGYFRMPPGADEHFNVGYEAGFNDALNPPAGDSQPQEGADV